MYRAEFNNAESCCGANKTVSIWMRHYCRVLLWHSVHGVCWHLC